MIDIAIPNNKPIVVLSSYRTGSTAFCDWAAKQTNFTNFDEAFLTADRVLEFLNFRNKHDTFIVKAMYQQITPHVKEFVDSIIDQCTVIRLRRRDVFAQIISYYIASIQDNWHRIEEPIKNRFLKVIPDEDFKAEVAIDLDELKNCAFGILSNNYGLATIPYKIDMDLVYEDIGILSSSYKLLPQTANKQQIKDALQMLIDTDPTLNRIYHSEASWWNQ